MRPPRLGPTMRLAAFALAAAGGCGGAEASAGDGGVVDARPPWVCWPDGEVTPRGAVELGTGFGEWIPLPAEVVLVPGAQEGGGYLVEVNARISGLFPGDPEDSLAAGNPRTRFSAFLEEGGESLSMSFCGSSIGYEVDEDERLVLAHYQAVPLDAGSVQGDDLIGRQVRLVVEVIDRDGGYARDEQVITTVAPPMADAGPGF